MGPCLNTLFGSTLLAVRKARSSRLDVDLYQHYSTASKLRKHALGLEPNPNALLTNFPDLQPQCAASVEQCKRLLTQLERDGTGWVKAFRAACGIAHGDLHGGNVLQDIRCQVSSCMLKLWTCQHTHTKATNGQHTHTKATNGQHKAEPKWLLGQQAPPQVEYRGPMATCH